MKRGARRCSVNITPWFLLLITAAVVLSGFRLAVPVLIAAAVHELGHASAIALLGGRVTGLRLGALGAEMEYDAKFTYLQDAAVAIAGPAAGAALAAVSMWAGRALGSSFLCELAAVSLVYTAFNLLPLGDMDGGRAAYAVICRFFGIRTAEIASLALDVTFALAALGWGIYVLIALRGNPSALLCAVFVINGCCKRRRFIV